IGSCKTIRIISITTIAILTSKVIHISHRIIIHSTLIISSRFFVLRLSGLMISSINLYDLINYESEYCERNQSRNCSNYEQDYIFKDLYHSLKAIHYLFSKSLKESRLLNLSSRVF